MEIESDVAEVPDLLARYLNLRPRRASGTSAQPIRLLRTAGGYRLEHADVRARVRLWTSASLWLLEAVAYALAQATENLVLHAGAIAGREGAVVFLGEPFAGKTSLAFAAWRRGLRVLGDDRIVVDGDVVQAFPKCLKVRGGGRCLLPEDRWFRGAMAGDRRLVIARTLPGIADYDERFPLRRLVIIERGARTGLRTIPLRRALARLLPTAGLGRRTPIDLARTLNRFAEGGTLPLLRIGDGDVERAVGILADL